MTQMQTWDNKYSKSREDKSYPSGAWDNEPDKAVWIDEASDLDCMIHRNPMGALCGYVGVGPDHPWHGKDYMAEGIAPDVHGGLTYANECEDGDDPALGICHVAQPGRPDPVWWFGFDCGHSGDEIPGMAASYAKIGLTPSYLEHEVYRDFAYVKSEVTNLARQIAEAA